MIMLPASPDTGNAQLTAADRHSAPATNHASAHPVSHGAASSHVAQTLKLILVAPAIGFMFGFAFVKSLVVSPLVIRKQMLFRTEIMLKMFLAATVVGGLIISVLELMKWRQRTSRGPRSLGLNLMKGYGSNIAGGLLLGIGITLTGSCPGTVFAQLGAGVSSAPWVLLGGFAGTVLFSFFHKRMSASVQSFDRVGPVTMIDKLLAWSFVRTSLAASALLVAVIALTEFLAPSKDDITKALPSFPVGGYSVVWDPAATAWSPITSGVLVGLLQLPSFAFGSTALGASASYVTLVSYGFRSLHRSAADADARAPYLSSFRGLGQMWQVAVVIGISLGALASMSLSGLTAAALGPAPTVAESIVGGALLLFGARLAGGCTSGHGISGMAQLSVPSVVTVCAMFAGAIAAAFIGYR